MDKSEIHDDEHRWLAENATELSEFARRAYEARGRGAVQIRIAPTDPETGEHGDRLDYRAEGWEGWTWDHQPATGRRVATYDPEAEFVAMFCYAPRDPNADAWSHVHSWPLQDRVPQLVVPYRGGSLADRLRAKYREWGLAMAPITVGDRLEMYRLVETGAACDELHAFFRTVIDRAIAEERRLHQN